MVVVVVVAPLARGRCWRRVRSTSPGKRGGNGLDWGIHSKKKRRVEVRVDKADDGGNEYLKAVKALIQMSTPVIAVEACGVGMGVVDIIMAGAMAGEDVLAACGLGNALTQVVYSFGSGLVQATEPAMSQSFGAKDRGAVLQALKRGCMLIFLACPLAGLLLYIAGQSLPFFGQPVAIAASSASYSRVTGIALAPFLLYQLLRHYVQAHGDVWPVLVAGIISNIINVFLNWFFLARLKLGVVGLAMATSSARCCMLVVTLFLVQMSKFAFKGGEAKSIVRFDSLKSELRGVSKLANLGIPLGIQSSLEWAAFAVIALLSGSLANGKRSLAIHNVLSSVTDCTFMLPLGLSAAGGVLVGQSIGKASLGGKSLKRETEIASTSALGVGTVVVIVTGLLMCSFPPLIGIWTKDESLIRDTIKLLPVISFFQIFDGVRGIASAILRGSGKTSVACLLSIMGFWVVGLPTGFILSRNMGLQGIWLGMVIGLGLEVFFLLLYLKRIVYTPRALERI